MRKPCEIAWDILECGRKESVAKGKQPGWLRYSSSYLKAMLELDDLNQNYGADEGSHIARYARCNLTSWRGDEARRLKSELDQLLDTYTRSR